MHHKRPGKIPCADPILLKVVSDEKEGG